MNKLLSIICVAVSALTVAPEPAFARAGTLISCEGISTQHGYRYVGIYCADFQCRYTITRMFDSYCPYSI